MSGHFHSITGIARRSLGGRLARGLVLVVLAAGVVAGFGPAVPAAAAATTTTVNLGTASTYAVLSGASVGNTASGPVTTLRGDLGVSGNAAAQPSGFPPGVVTGTTRVGSTAVPAYNDLVTAYNEVVSRSPGTAITTDLGGLTLTPGLYSSTAAVGVTGTLTLDGGGDPNAVFVFQDGAALTVAASSKVLLTNGAQASNVFWQVNGAATIGASARFTGTLMATAAIGVGAGTIFNGRALSENGAIGLNSNEFYSAPPTVSVTGGATAITNNSSPTITGTTDVTTPVTVTVAGQTLTPTPSNGTWSVSPGLLANATYPVTASVTDGAGNTGSAGQQLTIDTVPPSITIGNGASVLTNNPTPTITGTSDVAANTVVGVTVDGQPLSALVQPGGSWNVTPSPLSDGTHTVTASVTDPAGNESTASEALTVDTVPPAVTIAGGANALTDDATPTISGIANGASGMPVTVTLADQTLTGLVGAGGAWSVTAAALIDGPHRVVMSVSDAAGNTASLTQTLTVDTVAPLVTITGGPTAATDDVSPTIAGTTDAAPGTIVTVSIGGQTMTTLVQADGRWNATATSVGKGIWRVIASIPDPAGNVGIARQSLTIGAAASIGVTVATGGSGSSGATGSPSAPGSPGATGSPARVAVTVSCAAAGRAGVPCRGSISATSRVMSRGGRPEKVTAALARARRHAMQRPKFTTKLVRVASGSYSVATGKRATITLALNGEGRKLLARFYRVPATLDIAGTISTTRPVTFRYGRVRAAISARWTVSGSSTSVSSLMVSRLPAKSKVTLTCGGAGCPFARRTFSPKAKSFALAAQFGNAKLKPQAIVEITVGVAGQVGQAARFAVRGGRPPTQTSLCLVPGIGKPVACATP